MAESGGGAPGADSAVNPAYSIPMVAEGENETLAIGLEKIQAKQEFSHAIAPDTPGCCSLSLAPPRTASR